MFDTTKAQGDSSGDGSKDSSKNSTETPIRPMDKFSFEDLAGLAIKNPVKFEALRTKLCQDLIKSAPKRIRRRLNGLQFTIDMERQKAKTPLAACIKLSYMMHESLAELQQALNNPEEYKLKRRKEEAKIIQFSSLETI